MDSMLTVEAIIWIARDRYQDELRAAERRRLVHMAMQHDARRPPPRRTRLAAVLGALVQSLRG
jgi:hypothetical protein